MKSKKSSQAKKETKKTSKSVVKNVKPVAKKPVAKKSKPIAKNVKSVAKKITKPSKSLPIKTTATFNKIINKQDTTKKIPELFKNFYREGDRIFLRTPKKFAGFPDLLDLQKR